MRILLAGGTGVLGRSLTPLLTAEGHQVSSLGRGTGNALRADLLDREAVLRAVDGLRFDAVVHAATALAGRSMGRHQDMLPTDELRIAGTANLLAAARATGAGRLVAESMMFGYGYGDHGDRPLTEQGTAFGPKGANAWLERHVGAMRTLEGLTLGAQDVEGVALRFGLFYGAGVTDTTLLPLLRRRALPVVADQDRQLAWTYVPDAAAAVLAALHHGRAGRAYNIADDAPVGFGRHIRAVAEAFGTPRPLKVPLWVMRAAPLAYSVMSTNLRLSSARAKAELGWAPSFPDSVAGVRELARQLGAGAKPLGAAG
ncbi:nucleoside-diphosphate-sugar epimerase [Kitasatospora sp. MAA4]|uniref:NAD-dependent epimerase/dehydratase family protein n=1 Tax=Kitasatospora sp. MAA4 TaxID=3035093 RepID=UPI002474A6B4|nr:NAD(P)-dependent oxidoreductase [Kitasatospora sp. MAA4]MDH6134026.1 nucleoside-diphosphate-sugar epimerase [Kitasatospora sp. MAA4]